MRLGRCLESNAKFDENSCSCLKGRARGYCVFIRAGGYIPHKIKKLNVEFRTTMSGSLQGELLWRKHFYSDDQRIASAIVGLNAAENLKLGQRQTLTLRASREGPLHKRVRKKIYEHYQRPAIA